MGKHANKRKTLKQIDALAVLPKTSNLSLTGPRNLTLAEFYAAEVDEQTLNARHMIYLIQNNLEHEIAEGTRADRMHEAIPIHTFANGMYKRQLTMPAGTVVVGKRHAQEHFVTMTAGHCTVYTEHGCEDLHVTDPCNPIVFVSPAGEKRVLLIHEKTHWIVEHRTNALTVEEAEEDVILAETSDLGLHITTKALEDMQVRRYLLDRIDTMQTTSSETFALSPPIKDEK